MTEQLRTVLIFAHECAPYHRVESTVGAQRPAQFAKYLPEFGWRAIVVCCDSRQRESAERADLESLAKQVRQTLRSASPGDSVVIPTPSLKWDGWLDRCWRAMRSKHHRTNSAMAFGQKFFTMAKFLTGDYSQSWQPCARIAAEVIADEMNVDACLAEHSPDAGLFLARWFSGKYNVPWLADFRDPILQPLSPFARRLYAPVARRFLDTAVCTVNVNHVWAQLDHKLLRRPSLSIPNGFDPEEFVSPREDVRHDRFTIAYTGNIISSQRLEIFLEGLALLRQAGDSKDFRSIHFVYRGGASREVTRLAVEAGVGEIVDAGAHIERSQALALLRRADALLLLSIANPEREDTFLSKGLYPAKTFEYFGARRPILCVPGDQGLLDALIQETRTGLILHSPREVADYLAYVIPEWRAGHAVPYQPNDIAVEQYNRCNLTGQLADVLDNLAVRVPDSKESILTKRIA
jgi:glycosyltransferase involved in cell wall biosynthesis